MPVELRKVQIVNPGPPRVAKSGKVTDRALRYRANQEQVRPEGPRICNGCGAQRNIDIDHVNGREEDTDSRNLLYLCRSCNAKKGAHFARVGFGRKTNQYNPAGRRNPAKSLKQWLTAVMVTRGDSDEMPLDAAVEMIHGTSAAARSEFSRELWRLRKKKYGPSGRASEVPF